MIKKMLKKVAISSNPAAKIVSGILRFFLRFPHVQLLKFRKDEWLVKQILKIQREAGFKMWPDEMLFLYNCALAVKNIRGDFAEVGVSSGGSAKVLCQTKGEKILHLFDTFEGLPKPEAIDKHFKEKQYAASIENVKRYLRDYDNIFFYKGLFPLSAKPMENKIFSLVHLDVDLYQSTLAGLQFFYPRMAKGGIIVSHDYSVLIGVKKAFDEFFNGKPEFILELPTSQCLIVKM